MEEINGSRPNAAPKPKKRPNRFVRFLAFLVTLALMVGAVALVANYDKLNFDFIKRWFSYRTLARNDSGQAESFHFVGDSSNAFAVVDGDLLVCSPNTHPAIFGQRSGLCGSGRFHDKSCGQHRRRHRSGL